MYRNIHKKPLLIIQTITRKPNLLDSQPQTAKSMYNIQMPNKTLCLLNTKIKLTSNIENTDSFRLSVFAVNTFPMR